MTVLYVEEYWDNEENCRSISSHGQLGDQEEVTNYSEEEEEEEKVDGSNVSQSDQQEVNDNSEDEEEIIRLGSKNKVKNTKTESVNNLINEDQFLSDCEENIDNEMMKDYFHTSESSNNLTNDAEGLIDFEEKIKNTVVAVRYPPKKLHECEICSKKFRRQSNLDSHITTHVSDFFCFVCCKSFNTKFKLDCHLPEHPKKTINLRRRDPAFMICKEGCLGKFYSKLQLHQHKETHLEHLKNHICGVCNKRFNTFNKLNTHQKMHESIKCVLCRKTYASHYTFRLHSQRCHQKKIEPVTCTTCGAKFRHQGLLTNHETIHSAVKKYECAYCHKTFGRSNYLKDHLKTHFIDKPFKCDQCDSAFTQKNILVTHVKMKHRVCGMCDQNVGDALQLRVHLWKYHGREDPEFEIVEIEAENYTAT